MVARREVPPCVGPDELRLVGLPKTQDFPVLGGLHDSSTNARDLANCASADSNGLATHTESPISSTCRHTDVRQIFFQAGILITCLLQFAYATGTTKQSWLVGVTHFVVTFLFRLVASLPTLMGSLNLTYTIVSSTLVIFAQLAVCAVFMAYTICALRRSIFRVFLLAILVTGSIGGAEAVDFTPATPDGFVLYGETGGPSYSDLLRTLRQLCSGLDTVKVSLYTSDIQDAIISRAGYGIPDSIRKAVFTGSTSLFANAPIPFGSSSPIGTPLGTGTQGGADRATRSAGNVLRTLRHAGTVTTYAVYVTAESLFGVAELDRIILEDASVRQLSLQVLKILTVLVCGTGMARLVMDSHLKEKLEEGGQVSVHQCLAELKTLDSTRVNQGGLLETIKDEWMKVSTANHESWPSLRDALSRFIERNRQFSDAQGNPAVPYSTIIDFLILKLAQYSNDKNRADFEFGPKIRAIAELLFDKKTSDLANIGDHIITACDSLQLPHGILKKTDPLSFRHVKLLCAITDWARKIDLGSQVTKKVGRGASSIRKIKQGEQLQAFINHSDGSDATATFNAFISRAVNDQLKKLKIKAPYEDGGGGNGGGGGRNRRNKKGNKTKNGANHPNSSSQSCPLCTLVNDPRIHDKTSHGSDAKSVRTKCWLFNPDLIDKMTRMNGDKRKELKAKYVALHKEKKAIIEDWKRKNPASSGGGGSGASFLSQGTRDPTNEELKALAAFWIRSTDSQGDNNISCFMHGLDFHESDDDDEMPPLESSSSYASSLDTDIMARVTSDFPVEDDENDPPELESIATSDESVDSDLTFRLSTDFPDDMDDFGGLKYKHEIKCLPRCDPYTVLMADIKAEPKASSPNACLTSIGYCAQGCSHLAAASSKTPCESKISNSAWKSNATLSVACPVAQQQGRAFVAYTLDSGGNQEGQMKIGDDVCILDSGANFHSSPFVTNEREAQIPVKGASGPCVIKSEGDLEIQTLCIDEQGNPQVTGILLSNVFCNRRCPKLISQSRLLQQYPGSSVESTTLNDNGNGNRPVGWIKLVRKEGNVKIPVSLMQGLYVIPDLSTLSKPAASPTSGGNACFKAQNEAVLHLRHDIWHRILLHRDGRTIRSTVHLSRNSVMAPGLEGCKCASCEKAPPKEKPKSVAEAQRDPWKFGQLSYCDFITGSLKLPPNPNGFTVIFVWYEYKTSTIRIYPLARKEEAIEAMEDVARFIHSTQGSIGVLHYDNEFTEWGDFQDALKRLRFFGEAGAPRTPFTNLAEHAIATLVRDAKRVYADGRCPDFLIFELLKYCCQMRDVIVCRRLCRSPFEARCGRSPNLTFAAPFGAPVSVSGVFSVNGKPVSKNNICESKTVTTGYLLNWKGGLGCNANVLNLASSNLSAVTGTMTKILNYDPPTEIPAKLAELQKRCFPDLKNEGHMWNFDYVNTDNNPYSSAVHLTPGALKSAQEAFDAENTAILNNIKVQDLSQSLAPIGSHDGTDHPLVTIPVTSANIDKTLTSQATVPPDAVSSEPVNGHDTSPPTPVSSTARPPPAPDPPRRSKRIAKGGGGKLGKFSCALLLTAFVAMTSGSCEDFSPLESNIPDYAAYLNADCLSPTVEEALSGPDAEEWLGVMQQEFDQLSEKGVFSWVPRSSVPLWVRLIPMLIVLKQKLDALGNPTRKKGRVCLQGCFQRPGTYTNTFSPCICFQAFRFFLILVCVMDLECLGADITGAYLHGFLTEDVFGVPPRGVPRPIGPDGRPMCLKFKRSLYGLRVSGAAWYAVMSSFLFWLGFKASDGDACFFIMEYTSGAELYSRILQLFATTTQIGRTKVNSPEEAIRKCEKVITSLGSGFVILILYVDDFMLAGKHVAILELLLAIILETFPGKQTDVNEFIGLQVIRDRTPGNLSIQAKQTPLIVEAMRQCGVAEDEDHPPIPMPHEQELVAYDGPEFEHPFNYLSVIGICLYLSMLSRSDIGTAVAKLARFNAKPGPIHFSLVRQMVSYLAGTIEISQFVRWTKDPLSELSDLVDRVIAYGDADWAGDSASLRSTTGLLLLFCDNLVSCRSALQRVVASSTAEAETHAFWELCKEVMWFIRLVGSIGIRFSKPIVIYCDNTATVALVSSDSSRRGRTKHWDIKIFRTRQWVADKKIVPVHIDTDENVADFFTKPLALEKFAKFRRFILRLAD